MEINPKISRSSVYRCFVKEEINQIPQEKKDKAKKFKEYETPFTPKTNGMVEPVNGTIKSNTI